MATLECHLTLILNSSRDDFIEAVQIIKGFIKNYFITLVLLTYMTIGSSIHLLSWRPTRFRRTPQEHPPIQGLHPSPLLVSPNSSPSPGAPSPPSSLSPHPSPTNNIAPPLKSKSAGRVQSPMSNTAGGHSNQHTTLHLSHLKKKISNNTLKLSTTSFSS